MTITLNGTTGITTPALTNEGGLSGTTGTFSGLISANGGQIKFPATQSASSDANTLDDYEEGTWACILNFGSYSGESSGATYGSHIGNYIKIGRFVALRIALNVSNKGSATGYLAVTNLPFPVESVSYADCTGAAITSGITFGASNYGSIFTGANGQSAILLLSNNNTGNSTVTNSNCASSFYAIGTLVYTTTA